MNIPSDKVLRGYKVKIYPTKEQIDEMENTFHIYRTVYNIALGLENEAYEKDGTFITFFSMCKIFSKFRNDGTYPWLKSVSMGTIRQALNDLDRAYSKFFKKFTNHPRFKSRKYASKTFETRSERTYIKGTQIQLSGFENGYIEAKDHHIPKGRMYNTRVTFDGDDYWFSCQMLRDKKGPSSAPQTEVIGVDVGIRNLATTSVEETYHFPDSLKKLDRRKKRQQKRLSRYINNILIETNRTKTKYEDIEKSKNMQKCQKALRKTYKKISNIRNNYLHEITKSIVESNPKAIVIEDIKVKDFIKDPWMRKYIPEMCFYDIHRRIIYKAEDRNIPVIKAPKEYPSTKKCSRCGMEHDLHNNKIFKCPNCGLRLDRDINAAFNLRDFGIQMIQNA